MITIHDRRTGQPSFPETRAAFLTGNALQLAVTSALGTRVLIPPGARTMEHPHRDRHQTGGPHRKAAPQEGDQ